jgi:methionyl-tRNA synthetase
MVKKLSPKLKEKKFYVTTPIYYPNDIPHIGHAYTTIAADILSRWHKLHGEKVFFLTGTDEHGKKLQQTAEKAGKKPKEFVDALIPEFKSAWKKLNINYDFFIRTTDSHHEKIVQEMLQKSFDNGDIYLGEYEGLYCTGCEAYYTEKDLEDGCCPIHKKPIEKLKEKTYFFKLSKYQNKLLDLYKKNPGFVLPKERANQVVSQIKEGLQDLSISRTSFDWGIPLPFDKKHVCYVWFDALFNYYTATRQKDWESFWPADIHLVGKDILWFHAVYWPAFLMSVGIDLPKEIFAHGWWTFGKEKISKSRGKVINIDELIAIAGVDSARYFLFREAVFGQDGDFSEKSLIDRHNNELANKLGNLVSRVSALAEKYGLTKTENKLLKKLNLKKIETHFENYEIDKVLNEIFAFIDKTNEYVQETKPWETQDKKVLYELADSIKAIAILLSPFMPEACEKISKVFNFKIDYKELDKHLKVLKITKAEILFTKIEIKEDSIAVKDSVNIEKVNKEKIVGVASMVDMIKYDDFAKLDLRVGTIKNVEPLEGADKLWKLTVDLGSEIGQRTILAGIKKYYSKEQLTEKQIIVIVNLEPRKMKGSESQGMLLAAGTAGSDTCILISPEKNVENGTKIG